MSDYPPLLPWTAKPRIRRAFASIRTRILAWYILLMAASSLVAILGIRHVLLTRMYERIDRYMEQEVQEFEQLVDGRDPETGDPFGDDIEAIFRVFLSRNIPYDGEFLITILNGEFYRSSPNPVPEVLAPDSDAMRSLVTLKQPIQYWIDDQGEDEIIVQALPIVLGENRGVFVVAHVLSREQQDIDEITTVIAQVMLSVLAIASLLAWLAAGRALAPLVTLTEAVRTIRESDLTRRIPVQGADEVQELTVRFNEMLDRLQTAFASQRNFISDAGHELRTPITIIRGHLELLGTDPVEQQETLAIVTDELDRMSRFVSDLLLLTKAEQPNFLHLDLVDLGPLTEEWFAKAKTLGDRHWVLEAKGTGRIVGDRQRLTQAMMNLAQNATHYTHPTDTIAIGAALEQTYARLWVRDTGQGIGIDDQERIFERFARAANSQRRSEGAGLGLAIVRAIVQSHGGRVELVSELGGGSTFTLVIPIDRD
jgi:signal transduction histidine kinase